MDNKSFKLSAYVFFILVALLIIVLFPREGRFRYSFSEGKPWKYGLVTAPFDFPVFKPVEELKREQDSVLMDFRPYFHKNEETADSRIEKFEDDYRQKWDGIYVNYVTGILRRLYNDGILLVDDYNFLKDNRYDQFKIFDEGNVAVSHSVKEVHTVKSAYSFIFENSPAYLNQQILRSGNLNTYLTENLKYDAETSEKVKSEILHRISPSNGMVQAGERIVDRGEIIDKKTFDILSSLKQVFEERTGSVNQQIRYMIGIVILVTGLMACFLFFLHFFRSNIYHRRKHIIFMLSLVVGFTLLTEMCIRFQLFNIYIIPFAIIPLAIRTFFDSRTAQMTHNITVLMCSLMVPFPFEFIILQFMTCMMVIFILKDLTKRSQLIQCSFYVLMTYIVVYVGLVMIQEGDWTKINWRMFTYFGINFVFLMFTYSFIYIIEKIFGYISNVTLVELSDINTPILRELSEKCPGTFQHSLQVSMLGTAVANKVRANPQLIRTGALYHDIGKMVNPAFFIENQVGGINPHDRLDFEESAKIIISHVEEGVKIARKNNLPVMIIDFIRTHHGRGKTKYFYNSYKNKYPDKPVDEAAFTYPGPNPYTKETAILMMADSVEAASRSLKEYTEETISDLVNKIIDSQIRDGLLARVPLTFQNITDIKEIFIDKLATMYHSRISYPDLKENMK
ncbi:MAG: HDIG domain-containing protein [Dysgonamonadaceae bacterium]|jgi:putative nucleotidyltransferase with HDIG domain|nr:HDIG domain-containing protein [Dysgonamonadaceae bacterium]